MSDNIMPPGEAYYTSICGEIPLMKDFRYMRIVTTTNTGINTNDLDIKLQHFGDIGVRKTFNNTIDRAKGWLRRWER